MGGGWGGAEEGQIKNCRKQKKGAGGGSFDRFTWAGESEGGVIVSMHRKLKFSIREKKKGKKKRKEEQEA